MCSGLPGDQLGTQSVPAAQSGGDDPDIAVDDLHLLSMMTRPADLGRPSALQPAAVRNASPPDRRLLRARFHQADSSELLENVPDDPVNRSAHTGPEVFLGCW